MEQQTWALWTQQAPMSLTLRSSLIYSGNSSEEPLTLAVTEPASLHPLCAFCFVSPQNNIHIMPILESKTKHIFETSALNYVPDLFKPPLLLCIHVQLHKV